MLVNMWMGIITTIVPKYNLWYDLTKEDFESFVVSGGVSVSTTTTTSSPVISPSNNLAAEFQKGVKQSITEYSKPKEDRFWNSYQRTLLSVANSHGIKNVFDPIYKMMPKIYLWNNRKLPIVS